MRQISQKLWRMIMEKQYVLYNPSANNGRSEAQARALEGKITDAELIFCDITKLEGYPAFFSQISEDDKIIICGGDGTLNRFINETADIEFSNSVYYYPTGSGNDFAHDVKISAGGMPVCIDKYLEQLPSVYVNGVKKYFINGVGYGIDGYCCEVGDKLRESSQGKKINYTMIAIKGLLFHFKPRKATVTVDGVTTEYAKVWIAPTMNGRCYGGGMMPTPAQDRSNKERKLSVMIFQGSGKLRTLMIFPSIFKGEHVKNEKIVKVFEGKDICVRFDRPTALQIDGETVLGVTEYRAVSASASGNTSEIAEEATV